MSNPPFNPNDYNQTGNNLDIENYVNDNFLRNNGIANSTATTNFLSTVNLSSDTNLNGNLIVSTKTISPLELSTLDGINTNQTIQQQINGIGGGGTALLSSNNIWGGTQQFNSNIIVNGATLTPIELSYIDNTTSNIQTQLNTNSTNTANNTTILSNNGITASTNVLSSIVSNNTNISNINTTLSNNGITSSTNVINSLDFLQSQINNLPNGSGSGVSYFLTNTTSTVNNQYLTISNIPANSTNQILTSGIITTSSGNVLMGQFITDAQLNITQIPAGIWDFNFYANLTNNNLSSYIIVEVYKYNGTATLLFTMTGDDINSSTIIPYNINSTQTSYTVLTTDYLMIRIYGRTTSTQNVTINIDYNSSNYYSHFHLPSIQRQNHNDLLNIQGGTTNDYQHLSTSQLNNINNPASTSQNGYLLSTDWNTFNNKAPTTLASSSNNGLLSASNWNTFNNKENFVIPGLTSQWYRGDKNWASLNKADVGLSNVDNTSDLSKPISTATQTALNLKQNTITQGTVNQYFKGDFSLGNNTDFITPRNGIIYVNGILGDDTTNDGLSIGRAYKTISAALNNTYINSGYQLVIYPGTYTGDITISQNNLSIVGTNSEIGGIINLNLNITITSNSTSIRLCSLTTLGITISGSANVYLKDCNINGNLTKSGSGYLSINNIIMGITNTISISGAGNCNILNGCQLGSQFTVNNSSAIVVVMNNQYITNVVLTAGIISIFQTVIYGKSTAPSFNCCTVSGTGSALYLNNCDLIDTATNNQYIISVASLNYYSLRNCYMNYSGSTLNGIYLSRALYFDDLYINGSQAVDVNRVQTLSNKTLSAPKLAVGNIIKTSNNNNITFVDSVDTIVNLSSNQTLTNKSLTTPTITSNIIKGATGGLITFLDTNDTIVNLSSVQNLSNKSMSSMTISDDVIRTSSGRSVFIPNSNDTFVNLNSIQTLTNKTLTAPIINSGTLDTNSTAITQLTTDNSTKLSTTAYVKNCLSSPNSYVGTSNATATSITLSTSYQDIASITIPVDGTYEINMNIMFTITYSFIASFQLYNNTTSTVVNNSFFTSGASFVATTSTVLTQATKTVIIENAIAGQIIKLRALSSGSATIYNNSTNGFTTLSYKMLGITTNVPLTKTWTAKSSAAAAFSMNFGTNNFYSLYYDGTANASSTSIKTTSAITSIISSSSINNNNNITSNISNNASASSITLSTSAIYVPGQKIDADFYDLINNRHFKITILFLVNYIPVMCVQQFYGD